MLVDVSYTSLYSPDSSTSICPQKPTGVVVARNFTAPRNARKPVQPMVYLLRAYCFTARSIKHSSIRNDQEISREGNDLEKPMHADFR